MYLPFLSYLTTLELPYPSETKMFPAASHATSVGRLNVYGCAGGSAAPGGGVGFIPSTDSGLLPRSITPRPRGLNLTNMFVPSSTAQLLSCGSTCTASAHA